MTSNPTTTLEKVLFQQLDLVVTKTIHLKKYESVTNSEIVCEIFRKIWPADINHRESSVAIYLSRNNKPLGYSIISIGGITGTVLDTRVIFQHALTCNACSFIIAHSHPSGNLKPSIQDDNITKKLKCAGEVLEILLLDHLILTDSGYFSYADEARL